MSKAIFSMTLVAVVPLAAGLLAGCGEEPSGTTTGLFDNYGPSGPGGGGVGGGDGGGGGSTTTTAPDPNTYEGKLQIECEARCQHASEVSKMVGCTESSYCVVNCVKYGLDDEVKACGADYLAILKCVQVEDSAATCQCGPDFMLKCQTCMDESEALILCLEGGP